MEKSFNANRLFVASCLALLVTSLTFAIRARIEGVFNSEYGLTGEEIGWAFGPAFWGFTIAMFLGWAVIGLIVYALYGYRHSDLARGITGPEGGTTMEAEPKFHEGPQA